MGLFAQMLATNTYYTAGATPRAPKAQIDGPLGLFSLVSICQQR